jgi:hypothetical protein
MTVLNPKMLHLFETIEFHSIGHLLEVYQGFQYELPPDMMGTSLGSKIPPHESGAPPDMIIQQCDGKWNMLW